MPTIKYFCDACYAVFPTEREALDCERVHAVPRHSLIDMKLDCTLTLQCVSCRSVFTDSFTISGSYPNGFVCSHCAVKASIDRDTAEDMINDRISE